MRVEDSDGSTPKRTLVSSDENKKSHDTDKHVLVVSTSLLQIERRKIRAMKKK